MRDRPVVTGSQRKNCLAAMRAIADEAVVGDPYALTSRPFIYRDGRFQPFNG